MQLFTAGSCDEVTVLGTRVLKNVGMPIGEGVRGYGPNAYVVLRPWQRAPWVSGYPPAGILSTGINLVGKDGIGADEEFVRKVAQALDDHAFALAPGMSWRPGPEDENGRNCVSLTIKAGRHDVVRSLPWLFAWSFIHEAACVEGNRTMGPMFVICDNMMGREKDLVDFPEDFVHPADHPDLQEHFRIHSPGASLKQLFSDMEMFNAEPPAIGYRTRWFKRVAAPIKNNDRSECQDKHWSWAHENWENMNASDEEALS